MSSLDKSDILAGLFASWDDIDTLMAGLAGESWQQPTPLPGWSVHDVLSHIIGTESMLAGVPNPVADIDVSALEHVRNQIGEMNECWVRELRDQSAADMLERFRAVTAQRRDMLTAMTEKDWNTVGFTPAGPDTYGRFMRIRTFDCWMHELDIRQALSLSPTDDELGSAATARALDEISTSMGFVVGKLGKAPDGSRIALELTGPVSRTIRVAVTGRAAVVEDFGGAEPTAVIRLDGLQFTRLCGGRPPFDSRPAAIEFDGDVEVGQRVVENLNYVI